MTTTDRWRTVCQDAGDGSGDLVVELPSDLLERLNWTLGDELTIEIEDGIISIRLKQRAVGSSN